MPSYVSHLKHLDNNQKELVFRSTLTRQLASKNYKITTPTPDTGQDFWISDRKQTNIFPAQLKSSFGIHYLKQGRVRRYIVNIKKHKLEGSFGRKFLYFIGLYEPNSEPPDFHIGCVPSSFFEGHWEFLKEKKLQKNRRVNIEIDIDVAEGRYFMFTRPLFDVTDYFTSFDAMG